MSKRRWRIAEYLINRETGIIIKKLKPQKIPIGCPKVTVALNSLN